MFEFPGAAIIHPWTSPSFRNTKGVFLNSLPMLDYVKSPEAILEVGAPRNRKTQVGGGTKHAPESGLYPCLCSSKLSLLPSSRMDLLASCVSLLSISSPAVPQVLHASF